MVCLSSEPYGMVSRKALWLVGCGLAVVGASYAFQRPFKQYPGVEYFQFETPPDYQDKAEYEQFARLMFPPGPL